MEIQLWRELLDPYQLAVDELTVKFHHIIEEHRNQGLYSPIESVDGRVKSIVSILDKMQRKNVSMNDIEKKIEDLAGIRIICQFVEDIDRVVNLIKNRTDMKVKCEKDYVSHMKTSGYRSYHMIILYTVNKGDNVYRLAKTFNSEVPWIRCMNNLNEDMLIHPNQQLMIPIVYQKVNPLPQPYQRQSYDLYF